MIKISKIAEPNTLTVNKVSWTNELMGFISRNEKVPENIYNRYNSDSIKTALRQECLNKCMYCESPISHISYEHIEHIKPKAKTKFPHLTYDWLNLGLACPVCNMNKGDFYDDSNPCINPYVDEPSQFVVAVGHFLYHIPGNQRGEVTKRILKLNRPDLVERRLERIESLVRLIDKYHTTVNLTLKTAIREEIEIEIQEDKPYSMYTKSIYNALIDIV